ncbi:Short transient receptor potential channel 2-like [Pristimantis euphronides]
MAPIKICHIVSFSSQDPKHPVENLLMENVMQPWLGCPRDRSRQLRVELQLERACHIGYVDIGNSGSAFLQIDVGRSIWPLDKAFTTLLPTTTLMSPADSRAMRNHRGVRMFKEGDFLQEAAQEKWDRLRVTCTQPFHKQEQFGLFFLRVRSTAGEEHEDGRSAPQDVGSSTHSRLPPTADTEDPDAWSNIGETLREKLRRMSYPSLACTSRSARMLQLSAARSRKRGQPVRAPASPPIPLHGGGNQKDDSPVSSGSCPDTPTERLLPSQKGHMTPSGHRRLKTTEAQKRKRTPIRNGERHLSPRRERDRPSPAQRSPETDANICPICGGCFPAAHLPTHAATCGEGPALHSIVLSSSDDDWDEVRQPPAAPHRAVSRVQCPLCGFPFRDDEIEGHASTCGE